MPASNDAFLTHEALHMACFLMKSVDAELLEHPAIKSNPGWNKLAETAHQALYDLYQAIGKHTHVNDSAQIGSNG